MSFRAAAKARIGTAAEAQIARQCEQRDVRERGPDEFALPSWSRFDYHDFVIGIAGQGFDTPREVLLQQGFSVPSWG